MPGEASADRTRRVPAGPGALARVLVTDRRDGDLQVDGEPEALEARRRAIVDRPWVWLRQVHGADVVVLDDGSAPELVSGSAADAVVTRRTDVALAVHSADCATIALVGEVPSVDRNRPPVEGAAVAPGAVVAAVHAGWRGIEAGVVPATVQVMRDLGAGTVRAVLGPCIGAECYEFGEAELARVVDVVGAAAAGRTRDGRAALDVRLAVRAALAAAGVEVVAADPRCTSCGPPERLPGADHREVALFSHRARGDAGRQALVVWLERASEGDHP